MEEFTKSRMKEYTDCKAKGESAKEELAKFLQQAEKDLSSKVVHFKKEMEGLRTNWEASQKKAKSSVERLLTVCMEED